MCFWNVTLFHLNLAKWIVSRAKQEDLILHYNTPAYLVSDPLSFLSGHARATGRLKKVRCYSSFTGKQHRDIDSLWMS